MLHGTYFIWHTTFALPQTKLQRPYEVEGALGAAGCRSLLWFVACYCNLQYANDTWESRSFRTTIRSHIAYKIRPTQNDTKIP